MELAIQVHGQCKGEVDTRPNRGGVGKALGDLCPRDTPKDDGSPLCVPLVSPE